MRRLIQFISLVLFPVTLNYMSPYLIVQAASEGIISGSFLVFILLLITSVFFGRLFCSHICPAGAAGDILVKVNPKPVKKFKSLKWFIWTSWVLGIIMMLYIKGITKIDFLYYTDSGISVDEPNKFVIYFAVLAIIILLSSIVGRRSMCHHICWMAPIMIIGEKIGDLSKIKRRKLIKNSGCISCKKCNDICPMSIDVMQNVSSNDCIICGECVKVCPVKVLEIKRV